MASKSKIILCYSKEDNRRINEELKGWVTNFHKFLSNLLFQIATQPVKIDAVNEKNIGEINLEEYQAVIVISTPSLLNNPELVGAINAYSKKQKDSKSLYVDGVSRIFKVHKQPLLDEDKLEGLQDLIAYDFYLIDPLTGEAQEFTQFFGNDAERSYWMKMIDMAYDMNQLLEGAVLEESDTSDPRDKTVYLANTGMDLMIQRDVIKRELIRHGYKVLPHHTLPREIGALESVVKEDLKKCRIAIHMVGEDYGFKPTGSDVSIVDIQNRLASTHLNDIVDANETAEQKTLFSRLVWLSPDLKNVTERQKLFIEDLKSDAALLEEAEVLQVPLSEFKSIIREELVTGGRFNILKSHRGDHGKNDAGKIVYVIHDHSDQEGSKKLLDYLSESGYEVLSPSYEGTLSEVRNIHQENLRRCDASIVYFGQSKEGWIKTKLQDLLKAPGFGREKKMLAKAVYVEGQKEMDLMHYERNKAMILGNNGGFKPEHLKPFLTKLEKK